MRRGLVSFVIPVYNTERFLSRCVSSCLAQTYPDIEVVLVNDGSKDSSGDICRGFAEKDKRVVFVDKENGGSASARNAGLAACSGEFICFVDSDDYVDKDYAEQLHALMCEYDADCVLCLSRSESEDGTPLSPEVTSGKITVTEREQLSFYDNVFYAVVRNKMYRASALQTDGKWLEFDTSLTLAQDSYFAAEAVAQLRRMVKLERTMYHYVQNMSSATHVAPITKRRTEIAAWEKILELGKKLGQRYERSARYELTVRCFRVHRETIPKTDDEMEISRWLVNTMRENARLVLTEKSYPVLLRAVFLFTVLFPSATRGMNVKVGESK